MLARLRILWAALTWPTDKFFKLVELTYAGDFDEEMQRYADSGEATTRMEGMVVVSYVASEEGTVLYCRRPFYKLRKEPSYFALTHKRPTDY